MKKMLMVSVLIVAVAIAAKTGSNEQAVSDITMQNIEALSQTEDGKTYLCYGSGSVKCYDGHRVEVQYILWSLGDDEETE